MPRRLRRYQASFTAGELSDRLRGRRDTVSYYLGCTTLRNVLASPQGPCKLRPGTRHLESLDGKARFAAFVKDSAARYLVVLMPALIEVYDAAAETLADSVVAPYTADDLDDITWVQVGDTMLIAQPNHPLQELVREDATTWTIGDYDFEAPPQQRYAARDITLTSSAATGSVTITASAAVFTADMVGEIWEKGNKRFEITAFTSATVVTATAIDTLVTTASTDWTQQAATEAAGYFRAIAYHEGRLFLGGTASAPYRVWGSRVGQPYNFQVKTGSEVVDDDGVALDASSQGRLDPIHHLVSGSGGLEVFTAGHEGLLPSGPDSPITPSKVKYRPQSDYGARRRVRPVRLGAQTIFIQESGGAAREYIYDDIQQAYQAVPLTVRATHLVDDPVAATVIVGAWGLQADFMLVVNSDGTGAVMTSQKSEDVAAWSDWTSGRLLRDVAAVGSTVFIATEDAGGNWWLEVMDPDARFDAQATASSVAPQTAWSGFTHLAGLTAQVFGDGYDRATVVVNDSGELFTDEALSDIVVGLKVEPEVTPMPPDLEGQSLSGRPIRPLRCEIRHIRSTGLRVNGIPVYDRPFADAIATPPTAAEVPTTQRVYLKGWRRDDAPPVTVTREGSGGFELISLAVDFAVAP